VSLNVDPDGLLAHKGLGVLSGSESQLVSDVAALLDDPDRLSEIGAKARLYAVDRHNQSNIDDIARLLLAPRGTTAALQPSGPAL
jgi:hypothetical protein